MKPFEIKIASKSRRQATIQRKSKCFFFCGAVIAVVAFIGFIFISCSDNTNKQNNSINIVYNQSLDGSVRQVKIWCQENIENPESLEFFRWGLVKKTKDGFTVNCKYQSKNASGEDVSADQTFYMDLNGNIIKVLDNS